MIKEAEPVQRHREMLGGEGGEGGGRDDEEAAEDGLSGPAPAAGQLAQAGDGEGEALQVSE